MSQLNRSLALTVFLLSLLSVVAWESVAVGDLLVAPIRGPNLPILNPNFTPVSQFVGKQAVVSAHLPAGKYTALVVDGQVYVARMHNVALELAGRKGATQFYGFCEIDATGKVIRLFK